MSKSKLTEADIEVITGALNETDNGIRAAYRLLKKEKTPFAYGSVQKVAKQRNTQIDSASRIVSLQAQVRSLASEKAYLHRKLGDSLQLTDDILNAIQAIQPIKRVKHVKATSSNTPVSAVSPVCDWHIV